MGDMEFLDIKELIKKMINGEIQINRPLLLTSGDRTETEKISFLGHILKYNDLNKKDTYILDYKDSFFMVILFHALF